MTTDPRIDDYIAKAAPFARPILTYLRAFVHRTLPNAEETIKWGMPHFTIDGKNVCGMAAFKAHCAFVVHGEGRQTVDGMGAYGKITSLDELPPEEVLAETVHDAVRRIESHGSAVKKAARAPKKPELPIPGDLKAALADSEKANSSFEAFAPSHRREYIQWITEAKRAETRAKRIAQAIEWLADGKKRNWKYENC